MLTCVIKDQLHENPSLKLVKEQIWTNYHPLIVKIHNSIKWQQNIKDVFFCNTLLRMGNYSRDENLWLKQSYNTLGLSQNIELGDGRVQSSQPPLEFETSPTYTKSI